MMVRITNWGSILRSRLGGRLYDNGFISFDVIGLTNGPKLSDGTIIAINHAWYEIKDEKKFFLAAIKYGIEWEKE